MLHVMVKWSSQVSCNFDLAKSRFQTQICKELKIIWLLVWDPLPSYYYMIWIINFYETRAPEYVDISGTYKANLTLN